MHGSTRILIVAGLLICVLAVSPRVLWADVAGGVLLAAAEPAAEDADGVDGADDEVFDEDEEFEKETPLRIKLDYTLVTDYVWRGFNLTEYPGEGTERPSHQFGIDLALDLTELAGSEANLGHAGARIWFQSYEGYLAQTRRANAALGGSGTSGDHLQQVDYTLYWGAEFDRAAEVVENARRGQPGKKEERAQKTHSSPSKAPELVSNPGSHREERAICARFGLQFAPTRTQLWAHTGISGEIPVLKRF